LGLFGGIKGSALCATVVKSEDFSGSPGLTTAPELPPSMSLVKLVTTKPPRFLSGEWQLAHFA